MSGRHRFPFMQVDAFTDHTLGGNPCAVVLDADSIDDDTRQRIAQEMNLSETAFVQRSVSADVGARDAIETVKVGGGAVTVVRGELDLERAG